MGAPFNPLVCLLLQVGCTVINYLYGTDLLALLPNQLLGFKHGLNQEGTSPTPSFPRVGALNITRSQTEGTLEYPLFLYSFSSLPHAFWLDNWARSRYSHLPFVVSNETVFYFLGRSNLHKGEGGERSVRGGFLSLSRFSQLALEHYRILFQMNKRCNRCVCRRVFWDYLGLFKLSFPCAKGFCGNMSWLGTRRNFQPQTRRGQEISYPIPECPWLQGFVLGKYCFKAK